MSAVRVFPAGRHSAVRVRQRTAAFRLASVVALGCILGASAAYASTLLVTSHDITTTGGVPGASISLSQLNARVGNTITITGSNLVNGSNNVSATFNGSALSLTPTHPSVSGGSFSATFSVPSGALIGTPNSIVVTDATTPVEAPSAQLLVSQFAATDLGNATCSLSGTDSCAGPNVKTTSGATELIFVNLTGGNDDGSTTIASISSGAFSGASSVAPATEWDTSPTDYVFAYEATGAGNATASSVTVTFNSQTTSGSVFIDVVELAQGDTVVSCSGCANHGTTTGSPAKNFPVALTVSNPNDSEVAFAADSDGAVTPASGFSTVNTSTNPLTADDLNVQSTATFSTQSSNAKWGAIALEINP